MTSGGPSLPEGYSVIVFNEIDSTNEEARRRAEAGGPNGLWIVAHSQTAGRGRRGRTWQTGAANFAGTLLLRPKTDPAKSAQLSFVAALAVADALAQIGLADCKLKWPNDVHQAGAKISGVLLESASLGQQGEDWLAVGIGINLAAAPEGLPYPATSVRERGIDPPSPEAMLEHLARAWDHWYQQWTQLGFAPVREAWLARAAYLGGRASAQFGDKNRTRQVHRPG